MEIKEFLSDVGNYKQGRSKPIEYIVVHYDGNDGATAKGNCNYFKDNIVKVSANYFVDDVDVYMSVDPVNTAWHCGGRVYANTKPSHNKICLNANSIGVEMCSKQNKDKTYYFTEATMDLGSRFILELMQKYDIPIENVIRHYDVTGKPCPAHMVDDAKWAEFKLRLVGIPESVKADMKKIQDRVILTDSTMQYLLDYKHGQALITKLARVM